MYFRCLITTVNTTLLFIKMFSLVWAQLDVGYSQLRSYQSTDNNYFAQTQIDACLIVCMLTMI